MSPLWKSGGESGSPCPRSLIRGPGLEKTNKGDTHGRQVRHTAQADLLGQHPLPGTSERKTGPLVAQGTTGFYFLKHFNKINK